ncbi:hypothetical protein HNR10_000691 [Nocardiopsis aegyptia]|uniref:Uncharacterized protein n=1 Tax=Nocardiopsis aegyptia TaxID=220378 RepID=A0A7Z0EIP2_9ACTN|nr:hypothetical protein [Nocardiopsis aegyptia]
MSVGLERLPAELLLQRPGDYRKRIREYVKEGRCPSN